MIFESWSTQGQSEFFEIFLCKLAKLNHWHFSKGETFPKGLAKVS